MWFGTLAAQPLENTLRCKFSCHDSRLQSLWYGSCAFEKLFTSKAALAMIATTKKCLSPPSFVLQTMEELPGSFREGRTHYARHRGFLKATPALNTVGGFAVMEP
jgi:hypothetical protein